MLSRCSTSLGTIGLREFRSITNCCTMVYPVYERRHSSVSKRVVLANAVISLEG